MKTAKIGIFLVALALGTGCIGDIFGSSTKKLEVDKLYKARISKNWHEFFIKTINEDDKIKEAWALLNYGGWANDGQDGLQRRLISKSGTCPNGPSCYACKRN